MTCRQALFLAVPIALSCGQRPAGNDGRLPEAMRDLPLEREKSLPWISTYAGSTCDDPYVDGPRLSAKIQTPLGLALGPDGSLYVSSGRVSRVTDERVVTLAKSPWEAPLPALAVASDGRIFVAAGCLVYYLKDGELTTVAGQPDGGHLDGPALDARFGEINALSFDQKGALYVAERRYLRKLENGMVTTIAGNGTSGVPVDGPALEARVHWARAVVAVGSRVYFSDQDLVRVLENGQVTTFAGMFEGMLSNGGKLEDGPVAHAIFSHITGLAHHPGHGGVLFVSEGDISSRVRMIQNDLVTSLLTEYGMADGPLSEAKAAKPRGLATDAKGNLYFADAFNCRIRYIELQ